MSPPPHAIAAPWHACSRNGPPCVNCPQVVTPRWESTRIRARIRGFAGLPDGSEWLVDEIAVEAEDALETAAVELARRMLAAGAADLLRAAEAMAAQ